MFSCRSQVRCTQIQVYIRDFQHSICSKLKKQQSGPSTGSRSIAPLQISRGTKTRKICCQGVRDGDNPFEVQDLDSNQLQTQLNLAIQANEFNKAIIIRNRLREMYGEDGELDWRAYGTLDWLAHRLEQMGYLYPLEIQRLSCKAIVSGESVYVQGLTGSGKTLAYLIPLLSRLNYENIRDTPPQLLLLVPTFELGVQVALLTYQLFGGSIRVGIPDNPDNMFRFIGPRGLKVRGILSKEEVIRAKNINGYVTGAHVVVSTPDCIVEACTNPQPLDLFPRLSAIVLDEVDAMWENSQQSMTYLFQSLIPNENQLQIVCVGASADREIAQDFAQKWLQHPVQHIYTNDKGLLPASIKHKCIVCTPGRKAITLARLLRSDLAERGPDSGPARVIIFTNTEEEAKQLGTPLRKVLWGEHKVVVLLPTGENPVRVLHAFRDNEASLLIACQESARGLDLPGVTHVYNVHVPQDKIVYLHQAGRAGRIGNIEKHVQIVTLVESDQEQQALQQIADQLQFRLEEVPDSYTMLQDGTNETEEKRRVLEDMFTLLDIQIQE